MKAKSINVRESQWAPNVREQWADVAASIPGCVETEFALWQKRVDGQDVGPDKWPNHANLYLVGALRYAVRDDGKGGKINSPAEPLEEYHFWVVGQTRHEANEKVLTMLQAHGFTRFEWMLSCDGQVLILA